MAEFARDLGLIVLVWGSAANDSRNMKRLKELGVHGLIYDRFAMTALSKNEYVIFAKFWFFWYSLVT